MVILVLDGGTRGYLIAQPILSIVMQTLPYYLGRLSNLLELDLSNCSGLEQVPESLGDLDLLVRLELGFCQGLQSLPETLGKLSSLVELDLQW
jgi:Leucine-rich repeat (LRR) protein